MIETVRLVLQLFEPRDRRLLMVLLVLFVITALIQTVSVASILPFMSLVGDPDQIRQSSILSWTYDTLGFETDQAFLIFAGLVVLAVTAFSNALSAITQWGVIRFGWHHQYRMCVRLLSRYLSEPYKFFLTRNTAELTKTMFSEVSEVINGVIAPGMRMISQSLVVLSIFALLLAVDPWVAVISTLVLGGCYGILYTAVRQEQARLGRVRIAAHGDRYRAADEALSGIKESRVLGREQAFLDRFDEPSREYSRVSSRNVIIVSIPRFALETVALGGIIVITLYLIKQDPDDFSGVVAVMSLYALAGYRLMPALRDVFTGLAKVRFFRGALDSVHEHLRPSPPLFRQPITSPLTPIGRDRLPFQHEIRIDRVSFRYPNSEEDVLRDLSLSIPRRSFVGLVGGTGSGKTTLVDLLLGLLEPTEGEIRVDGELLTERVHRRWRRNVGYVPQEIFLCDDTITRNIAFGLPDEVIDIEAVLRAARIAQIHEFISSLPGGYDNVVGERGVRLSGGQRQRIGIARALYHDPEVLIFDEATSALDGITEDALMDAIEALTGERTMILVAHRVTTLKNCDVIHVFGRGRLTDSGTYDELVGRSQEFRAMAKEARFEGASAR